MVTKSNPTPANRPGEAAADGPAPTRVKDGAVNQQGKSQDLNVHPYSVTYKKKKNRT